MNHHPGTTPVTTLAPPFVPEDEAERTPLIGLWAKRLGVPVHCESAEVKQFIKYLAAFQALDREELRGTQALLDEYREISAAVDVLLGHFTLLGRDWAGWEGLEVEP